MSELPDWTIMLRGGPLAPDGPVVVELTLPELPDALPQLPEGRYERDPGHGLAYDWRPNTEWPLNRWLTYALFAWGILIQLPVIYLQVDTGNWALVPVNATALAVTVAALLIFRRRWPS